MGIADTGYFKSKISLPVFYRFKKSDIDPTLKFHNRRSRDLFAA